MTSQVLIGDLPREAPGFYRVTYGVPLLAWSHLRRREVRLILLSSVIKTAMSGPADAENPRVVSLDKYANVGAGPPRSGRDRLSFSALSTIHHESGNAPSPARPSLSKPYLLGSSRRTAAGACA
jgi:hypothetical protein